MNTQMICRRVKAWLLAIVVLAGLAGGARPAQAQANEVWDMEFTGKGDPRNVGFKGHMVNGSTFNLYDKFTHSQVMPGWLTANGNPGGYFYKAPERRNTQAGGWTAEWLLVVENNSRGLALNFNDDTSLVKVIYDEPANTVTAW